MTWLEILRIFLEEQLLIKYYTIKAFNITKNQNYDGYQRGLALMIIIFFAKMFSGTDVKSKTMPNQELAEKLNTSIIRKFEKRKVHSSFVDKIWVLILQICN